MNTNNLIGFLAAFGRNLDTCPVVWPAFNNYYQDLNVGGSLLGNLTLLNGERMFPPEDPNREYPDFNFSWYVDDVFKSDKGNPTLLDLKPSSCAGVVKIKLVIEHKPTGMYAERTEWAYLGWLDLPNCNYVGAPSQFGVFYSFYGGYSDDPQKYMRLFGDYDGDGVVDVSDLMKLLSQQKNG